jgi:glycosyltransferase involved in cell wall biosynthesis
MHSYGKPTAERNGRKGRPGTMLDDITVLIITYNEEDNIGRALQAVKWARHILVVDSGSTDRTLAIIAQYPHVRVLRRPFDNFANQCNYGLSQIRTSWVLSIDADYIATADLAREIARLKPSDGTSGFTASFVYCIYGKPLRATLYPPRTVLYRCDGAHYANEGHGHRVQIAGRTERLAAPIRHDDRKPLARWLSSQQHYARIEADHLLTASRQDLSRNDRIRLTAWLAPILIFPYTLLAMRCILDGRAGWLYAFQRLLAETMLAIELTDRRLRSQDRTTTADFLRRN